jgi:Dip2/Utp12 Family
MNELLCVNIRAHCVLCRQLAGGAHEPKADVPGVSDEQFESLAEDMPLAERLAVLEKDALGTGASDLGSSAGEVGGVNGATHQASGPVTADSLVVLLTQAIRAQDQVRGAALHASEAALCVFEQSEHKPGCLCLSSSGSTFVLIATTTNEADAVSGLSQALIDRVLSSGSSGVLESTVRRLPPRDAGLLLCAVVDRLQSRPARAAVLLPWARAALLHHGSCLAAAPALKGHLGALQRIAVERYASLQPLLALRGRVEYLLTHARAAGAGTTGEPTTALVRDSCAWL